METKNFIFLFFLLGFSAMNFRAINAQNNKPEVLRVSTFDVDATPPIGSFLRYDQMVNSWDLGLRAKGIVLCGAGQPIVLVAIDWISIDGESLDAFKSALAKAVRTIPERVAVHTLHQHDAPASNFAAERILKEAGLKPMCFESSFQREVIQRLEKVVENSLKNSKPLTHIGLGKAKVSQVASNRRILGNGGMVKTVRYTACGDPAVRAEPEGVIDPEVSLVSFWNNGDPVAVLSYYASHPQSYYRTGIANPDFPGIARFYRQLVVPDALHIHFDGAGGNIGAGKYNDGSHVNRGILAERLADGMKRAWEATKKEPISAGAIGWTIEQVSLPPAESIKEFQKGIGVRDTALLRLNAKKLAYLQRCQEGKKIDVECLSLERARILFMPGELFVEYQLAAKAMRPDLFVVMAAYGEDGPGYIGTSIAYKQGGYEATASNVNSEAEGILMGAIRKLLKQ